MVTNFQTALATEQTDIPLAWHFNDTLTPTPVKQAAAHASVRWADEIVVAADAVHDYYFDPETPSRIIYAPVDVNRFDPRQVDIDETALRSELKIDSDIPIVGTIGNINPIKGHKYLLQAIKRLVEDGQQIAVPIVGKQLDSRAAYFERLQLLRSELGLENQVQFVGFRSDIPELLSLFDVFIFPSVAEACPIAVLEAMAMKCPVVATNVGGVPEEIPNDDYGWVVPPEDSDALATATQMALDNPKERHRRAKNARDRVKSEFSLTACVDRHESLYHSVADES
jgi:glycosyltransferase involved in cell wall biosynthesis